MDDRVLTARELNRALLARQLLLERSALPLARAVERMGGIQAQYALAAYIGLWSRVRGFERADLTSALERRDLVQATLLRGTIHVVSAEDYWPWADAIREPRREWLRRALPRIAALDLEGAARTLRDALADRPRTRDELVGLVGKDAWQGTSLDLVRVPPSGTWERRRADLYAMAESWIPRKETARDDCVDLLARRYLGAFGPAHAADIRLWSGLATTDVRAAIARLGLRRFHDETGKELVDLADAPLPAADTPAPARFIATWDAMLLVHARRTGVLPEELRPKVFQTRLPFSMHTFLLDGVVAGSWRHEAGRIELDPFRSLTPHERRQLAEEAEALAAFHA
ncbi:winged helix DNA-binding domain-containing protein [soil metagenome]